MKDLLARIPRRRRPRGAVRTDGSATPIAGVDPATAATPLRSSFRDRGRLRRRLRYLRRVRELGFRDLGGLVFDQNRFNRPNEELVRGKLAALQAVDGELRALETLLDDPRPLHELREPGIAACVRCGALHGSDARFCPQCGTQFSGPLAMGEVGGAAVPATAVPEGAVPVSPGQEALPLSAVEQGTTPMSGALAGNPPAETPPAPAEEPVAEEPAPAAGEQPTTVAPPVPEPSTQAFPAGGDDANGHAPEGSQAMTSGDPLASRERSGE